MKHSQLRIHIWQIGDPINKHFYFLIKRYNFDYFRMLGGVYLCIGYKNDNVEYNCHTKHCLIILVRMDKIIMLLNCELQNLLGINNLT